MPYNKTASNMMHTFDVESYPLDMSSRIEVYDLTGDAPCVTQSIGSAPRSSRKRDSPSNRNDTMESALLSASFGSFLAPKKFERYTYSDYDNGIIRQIYADFSLDRLDVPPPPAPQQTPSLRQMAADRASNDGHLNIIFDMFQSPDLVQGDNDLSTPLPLETKTNPLITQVTFEDENGHSLTPMSPKETRTSLSYFNSDGLQEIDGETEMASTTFQAMEV